MNEIQAVTVYCSSSKKVDRVYFDAAERLGRAIARAGWKLVYGGNNVGLMGALADAARDAGGKVIGITPQFFCDKDLHDPNCHELIVTAGMRERKAILEQRGDAFVILPGGIGTFEEFFEILVGRQLGFHNKPIVLLNIGGFYDPLLELLDHGLERHFVRPGTRELLFVTDQVDQAIAHLQWVHTTPPPHVSSAIE